MANQELIQRKKGLRAELRRRLAEAPVPDHARAMALVETWLAAHPEVKVVALFAALPGEVDLLGLAGGREGTCWTLPRVAGDDMEFRAVKDVSEDLRPGVMGIREPHAGLPPVATEDIDLFVCPGLGFDPRGGRIGRGKGYYDRALAVARRDAVKLALVLPWQDVEDAFCDEHDIRMDVMLRVG